MLGGVGEWLVTSGDCTGVLKGLIEACLSRDRESRPTFEDAVDLLRALLDRDPTEIFCQLEMPRLREALAYGDDVDAAVAKGSRSPPRFGAFLPPSRAAAFDAAAFGLTRAEAEATETR